MNKFTLSAFLATICLGTSVFANDKAPIGVVNFTTCIAESKLGQKEQESMENIRKQMSTMIEDTEKELKEIAAKFEDTEFLDSLSPKAEEEMKLKFQTRQDDLGRYQNQFYQVLQQAQQHAVHKMSADIASAAEVVAKEQGLEFVINKEACFYIRSDLDVTSAVISQMDKSFESAKKLSDNGQEPALDAAAAEALLNKAG